MKRRRCSSSPSTTRWRSASAWNTPPAATSGSGSSTPGQNADPTLVTAFVVRRLARVLVVIVGVSLVTFAILHASGDPVALIMPEAPEADRALLRQTLGLHDPLPVQFARFVGNAVTGNFGKSFFHHGQSASALVLERMPTTLMLTVFSMGVALAIALPVGIYSAVRRGRAVDQLATGTVFLGQSMPVFWTGIMLILLFSVQWRLLPVSGWA